MTNLVAFIPARSGSKGIPDKNIQQVGGKTLLARAIESAKQSGIDRIVVDTDSETYAILARQAGAEVMMRPEELAGDKISMAEVLRAEIPKIDPQPEIIVLLQPTVPFRAPLHIKLAIGLLTGQECDSVLTAERVPDRWHPSEILVSTPTGLRMADGRKIPQRITSRQQYSECWKPTGSVYAFWTKNLETGGFYGEKTLVVETEPCININDESDLSDAIKYYEEDYANGSISKN